MYNIIININGDMTTLRDVEDLNKISLTNLNIDAFGNHKSQFESILEQIRVNNKAIFNTFYSYQTPKNETKYTVDESMLNYITIWDILKSFGLENVEIQILNEKGGDLTYIHTNVANNISKNLLNIYNARLYNIENKIDSKLNNLNDIIINQNAKKSAIKKEILNSILNMKLVEYFKNNLNIQSNLNTLKKIKIPVITNKVKIKNINVFENIKDSNSTFNLYKDKLLRKGVILHKHKENKAIYLGLTLGEMSDNNIKYTIDDVYNNKYNIEYMRNSNIKYNKENVDFTDDINLLFNYSFLAEPFEKEETILKKQVKVHKLEYNNSDYTKIIKFWEVLKNLNLLKISNILDENNNNYFKYNKYENANHITKLDKNYAIHKYLEYLKFITARYMLDFKYITYKDVVEEDNKLQKYFGNVLFKNKNLLYKIYLLNVKNKLSKLFYGYNTFSDFIKDNKVESNGIEIYRHLFSEYLIAKNTNFEYSVYTPPIEETKIGNAKENIDSNYTSIINKLKDLTLNALNDEKYSIIKANVNINSMTNLVYLIPLGNVLEYIDIDKINSDNLFDYIILHEISDYLYKEKKVKLYDENNIKKIKEFKKEYIANDSFSSIYKETTNMGLNGKKHPIVGINANYNITFKLKDIDKKIKKFVNYKNNLEVIENKLDISNIIHKLPFISVEDINNAVCKYKDVYVNPFNTDVIFNNIDNQMGNDTSDIKDILFTKIDLDLLRVLVYKNCHNMFKYVIPIKRKIDIYINSDENNKLDIIFFNDIKNIEYITNIFIKNQSDLRIFKSKYKYCQSIKVPVKCYYKDSNKDKEFKPIKITYHQYLHMKYKEGKVFDKYNTLFEKDFEMLTKDKKSNIYFKTFKIYGIPYNIWVCDIGVVRNESGQMKGNLQIGGKLLKNVHVVKAICYTLFNITLKILDRFGRYLEFKNFNINNVSFDVYENNMCLGKIFLNSTIQMIGEETTTTKTLENQILEMLIK